MGGAGLGYEYLMRAAHLSTADDRFTLLLLWCVWPNRSAEVATSLMNCSLIRAISQKIWNRENEITLALTERVIKMAVPRLFTSLELK